MINLKALVIGNGGREHAIIWKLNQSPLVDEIYCAPGNPGIGQIAKLVDIGSDEIEKLVEFSREIKIDIIIVGPEVPLVSGIVDIFRKEGLNIIGPSKKAAELEGSKGYSKAFMKKYGIPTANYDEVYSFEAGVKVLEDYTYPVVIKADGLAAGKGVLICNDKATAIKGLEDIMVTRVFGDAGKSVVIEEFLEGIETSILCFVDGNTIIPMVSSQDHKRVYDNDEGPNTGGMGTFSPNFVYSDEISSRVQREVLEPTLKGIQSEEMDYRGIIFIGLMITPQGPKVLEYNVRFGDPETQVILPRLKSDLMEIFLDILEKKLDKAVIEWSTEEAVCIVLASGGYPEDYTKGLEISISGDISEEVLLFHAGTALRDDRLTTNGGRVLGVTALGKTVEAAREMAYANAKKIYFEGMHYRSDIGVK